MATPGWFWDMLIRGDDRAFRIFAEGKTTYAEERLNFFYRFVDFNEAIKPAVTRLFLRNGVLPSTVFRRSMAKLLMEGTDKSSFAREVGNIVETLRAGLEVKNEFYDQNSLTGEGAANVLFSEVFDSEDGILLRRLIMQVAGPMQPSDAYAVHSLWSHTIKRHAERTKHCKQMQDMYEEMEAYGWQPDKGAARFILAQTMREGESKCMKGFLAFVARFADRTSALANYDYPTAVETFEMDEERQDDLDRLLYRYTQKPLYRAPVEAAAWDARLPLVMARQRTHGQEM